MSATEIKKAIQEAIEGFANEDLTTAGLHLFRTLGYRTDVRLPLPQRSYADFAEIFVGNKKLDPAKTFTDSWASVDMLFQLSADHLTKQDNLFKNEQVDRTIIESYVFFAIELKAKGSDKQWTRTDLSQITREVNKLFAMPVMILFKQPGMGAGAKTITLAIIDRRLHKKEASKDVLEKVTLIKDIRTTDPHRAHVEILFDLSMEELRKKHGFTSFPKLHEAWRITLDTKELNKRFFKELAHWYFHAVEVAEFPDDVDHGPASGKKPEEKREARNAINIIRLLTRLMFVWFLREKNLVPDALFDPKALKKILKPGSKEESLYYKAILQNLFFATLNTEMGKRKFRAEPDKSQSRHFFIHNVFRYEKHFAEPESTLKQLFEPIPFLNGGLFECLDKQVEEKEKLKNIRIDGFSDRADNPVHMPDRLFFDPEGQEWDFSEVYGTKKARKEKVRGLIDILGSYKFTIAENTPIEEEVALDPELLGKVFENLLANYNPETKTTARKQTGSFYTPREIVNYMVDESLIAYLGPHLRDAGSGPGMTTRIGAVGADHDPPPTGTGDNAAEPRLRHLLSYTEEAHQFSKKECDALIVAIDSCKILDPACGSGAFPMGVLHKLVHVLHKLDPKNTQWKERQIEKAAQLDDADIRERTEADIEDAFANNALDYGRKLYLIENGIYGVDIQPIAMQIAKLRFFISLVVDQQVDPKRENLGVRPLPNLETKFVAANTLMKLSKEEANLFTNPQIDEKKAKLKRVRHEYFEARTPKRKTKCREQDKQLRGELAELLMQEHELQPKEAKMLATWDPYDQNASAPFFDPEWMYGLGDGFHIVIGNPPYVRQETFKEIKPELQARYPETFTSIADLFTYFMQAGHDLLAPDGVFCYIVSNKWMRANYGKKLRAYLGTQTLLQLLDFGEQPVFEATAYTCVVLSRKATAPKDHPVRTWSFTDLPLQDLPGFMATHAFHQDQSAFVQADYRIGDAAAEALMIKLKSQGTTLGEYLKGGIYYGIKTGYNKAFVIDKETRDALIKADKRSKEVIKPFLGGKDIQRYQQPQVKRWLILLPIGVTKKLLGQKVSDEKIALRGMHKEYPAIMQRLVEHEEALVARDDQGHFWWELRSCDYYSAFEKPKIIYSEIAIRGDFLLDTEKNYVDTSIYIMSSAEHALLGYVNSSLFTFGFAGISSSIQGGYFRWKRQYMETMPYVEPNAKVRAQLEKLVDQRRGMEPGTLAEAIEQEIDQVVYGLYGLTAAEIEVVEGSGKKRTAPGESTEN